MRDAKFCVAESCSCSSDRKCSYLSPKCECPCTSPMQFDYCPSQFPLSRFVSIVYKFMMNLALILKLSSSNDDTEG